MTAIPSLTPWTDATTTALAQLREGVAPHLAKGGTQAAYARILIGLNEGLALVLARECDAGMSWEALRNPTVEAVGQALASAFDRLVPTAEIEGKSFDKVWEVWIDLMTAISSAGWASLVAMQANEPGTIAVDVHHTALEPGHRA